VSAQPLWSGYREPEPEPVVLEPVAPPPARARRLPARSRPFVVDALAALGGLGLGITLALGVMAESAGSVRADGGLATADRLLHQLSQLLWTYPGVLAATVAAVLLVAAGVTSYRIARRRLAYETWWAVHLYTYLALFLAFSHQVDPGASFVGHPWARAWWTALWIGALALVAGFRVVLPVWRSLRHGIRVAGVRPEGAGTFSVLLEGRRLDRLPVAGGQFLQ
jgi:lysylphosphatidylglycerol synthetase-like protein (DUF2156 family)